MVVVLTDKVTIGQLTFILRVVIRILTYGGLFLLGFVVLGHAPYVASVETHDVLNRTVGKATALKTSLKWISAHLFNRKKDPSTSRFLVLAILLSLSYSLLSLLSDVGFIGLQPCEIAGSSFTDFPASVKAASDAQNLMAMNMVSGADPANVRSYRCADSTPRNIGGAEYQVCTSWLNSTFADSEAFKALNLSDTDSLFPRTLARYKYRSSDAFDLNMYFVGTQGQPLWNATVERGLAIVPHDTGVRMVVGVPSLGLQQRVSIPQTTAVEIDVACMPLGIGAMDSASAIGIFNSFDMLQVDDPYKATRLNRTSGPDYLRDFLPKYADQVRDMVRPLFNTSSLSDGYIRSFNSSSPNQGWQTTVERYTTPTVGGASTSDRTLDDILQACSDEVHTGINALTPRSRSASKACGLYRLKGSFAENSMVILGHSVMLCATATQVNMVSAIVDKDVNGTVTAGITRIPSDIRMMQAEYYDVTQTQPSSITQPLRWGSIMRYTHTANPNGQTRHFILQRHDGRSTALGLTHGVGSAGEILSLPGSAMLNVGGGVNEVTLSLVNSAYMSIDTFRASYVTRWAGAVGAAFLYHSLTFNPWVSLGQPELTVQRTGGVKATCYNPPYGLAFLPLVLAAVFVVLWFVLLLLGRRIFGTKVVEQMYGGLGPAIVTPYPIKRNPSDLYVWQGAEGSDAHLTPVTNGATFAGGGKVSLVRQLKVLPTYDDGEK